ncbi:hemagglutinin repeat-containing protein [Vibrio coralliilyticus]|uniref:two-partner secretion domain-containing protein n=1 Tax=Vibrio coralliilyticus TaxID=190893 RepID=UPI002409820B|nr:hemagglutinin repeat-containing protein [Vibrio coralliilyticus]WFB48066.1 hemagglutinin repeat-containing protein [Vibrio coralliilyticus]
MDKRLTFSQVILTYALCCLMTLQPAMANVVIDTSVVNTSKVTAGNGVEVVNIATPDSNGLSHNKYQQFNVDSKGLILNNSTAQLAQSQLGGLLQNNPNLNGKSASVILNEVTGANRSKLEGYTEVFGQSANVILANPYGITCDGCGFINTPRVTFSTGTPEFEKGALSGFNVVEGSVSVEGLGLDASNQTYFDIISRTAEINAAIHANDLSIVTGSNQVEYLTNNTIKQANSSSDKPQLAIDSSSIGGMYAGRIALVATEDGVGVNVGELSTSQGNITISASGEVRLGRIDSAKSLEISSQGNVVIEGEQRITTELSIEGAEVAIQDAKVAAGQSVKLDADGLALTGSQIDTIELAAKVSRSRLDSNSSLNTQSAQWNNVSSLENQGAISVAEILDVSGKALSVAGSGTIQTKQLSISSDTLTFGSTARTEQAVLRSNEHLKLTEETDLSAVDNLTLSSSHIDASGHLKSGSSLLFSGENVVHRGQTQGKTVVIDSVSSSIKGVLESAGDLTVQGERLDITGTVQSTGEVVLTGGTQVSSGRDSQLLAGQRLRVTGPQVSLTGKTGTGAELVIEGDSVTLGGTVTSQDAVTVRGQSLSQSGVLASVGDMTLSQRDSVSLTGDVESGGALSVETGVLSSTQKLLSGKAMSLTADTTTLQGEVSSGEQLTLKSDSLTQSGQMVAKQALSLLAGEAHLNGRVQSDDTLSVTIQRDLNVGSQGQLVSQLPLTITSQTLVNQGQFSSGGDIDVSAEHLTHQGTISSAGAVSLNGGTLVQNGDIEANQGIQLITESDLVSDGDVVSGGEISVTAKSLDNRGELSTSDALVVRVTEGVVNRASGVLAGEQLTLSSRSITNAGTLQALDTLNLTADSLLNTGRVIALGQALINANQSINNSGVVSVDHTHALSSGSGVGSVLLRTASLTQSGTVVSSGDAQLLSDSQTLSGTTVSGGDLTVQGERLDITGTVQSTGEVVLTGGIQVSSGRDSQLLAGQRLRVTGPQVSLTGKTGTGAELVIEGDSVTLGGTVTSQDAVTVRGQSLSQSGVLASVGDMTLSQRDSVSLTGDVESGGALSVETGVLSSTQKLLSGKAMSLTADTTTLQGEVSSGEQLTLKSDSLTQSGQMVAKQALSLLAGEAHLNGRVQSDDTLSVTIQRDLNVGSQGQLVSQLPLTITSQTLVNQGQFSSGGDIDVSAEHLTHQGTISSAGAVSLNGGTLVQNGDIEANQGIQLITESDLVSDGDVVSGGEISVTAKSLDNRGELSTSDALVVRVTEGVVNRASGVLAGEQLTLSSRSITNAGTLQALDTLNLTADSLLNTGRVIALGQALINANQSINNSGVVSVDHTHALSSGSGVGSVLLRTASLTQSGTVVSSGDAQLLSDSQTLSGTTVSGGDLTVQGERLDITGTVQSTGEVVLTGGIQVSSGRDSQLLAGQRLRVTGPQVSLTGKTGTGAELVIEGDSVTLGGTVTSQDAVTVRGQSLSQSGVLASVGDMTLSQRDSVSLTGDVESGGALSVETGVLSSTQKLLSGKAMSLTADTTTLQGEVSSGEQLTLKSDSLTQSGQMVAKQALSLLAGEAHLNGRVQSDDTLSVTIQRDLNVGSQGQLVSQLPLTITSQTLVNQGQFSSGGDIDVSAEHLTHQGTISSAGAVSLNGGTLVQNGDIEANQGIQLITESDLVSDGDVVSGGEISVTAKSLDNRGELSTSDALVVRVTEGVVNRASGVLAGEQLTLSSRSITNAGTLQALDTLNLTADSLLNTGRVIALGQALINANQSINNSGVVSVDHTHALSSGTGVGSVLLRTASLTQSGTVVSSGDAQLLSDSQTLSGTTVSGGDLTVQGERLDITGTVQSTGEVVLTGGTQVSSGRDSQLLAGQRLRVTGPQVSLTGKTGTGAELVIEGDSVTLGGTVTSQDAVTVRGQSLSQSGVLASVGDMTLSQRDSVSLTGDVESGGALSVETGVLSSTQKLLSGKAMSLTADTTTLQGEVSSGEQLTLKSDSLTQSGQMVAKQALSLLAGEAHLNGRVQSDDTLSVTIQRDLNVGSQGQLVSQLPLTITSQTLVNQGQFSSGGDIDVSAEHLTHQGTISSAGAVSLNGGTLVQNGDIEANQGIQLITESDLVSDGDVVSGGEISVTAKSLDNRGELSTSDALVVRVTEGVVNRASGVLAGEQLTLSSRSITNAGTLQALDTLNLTADSLLNTGRVIALGQALINANQSINNSGVVSVDHTHALSSGSGVGSVLLRTASLTQSGTVVSSGDAQLLSDSQTLSGTTVSGGDLTVQGERLDITGTVQSTGEVVLTGGIQVSSGRDSQLLAGQRLRVTGPQVSLTGKTGTGAELVIEGDSVTLGGTVTSQDAVTVRGQSLSQSGVLASVGDMTLSQRDSVSLTGDVESGGALSVETGVLSSTQKLMSGKAMSIGADSIQISGVVSSLSTLIAQAKTLTQTGRTLSLGDITLKADQIVISGEIQSGQSMLITADNSLMTQSQSSLKAGVDLAANSEQFHHQGKWLSGGNSKIITNQLNNQGQLQSHQDFEVQASQLAHQGTLASNRDLDITVNGEYNNQHALIAGRNLHLKALRLENSSEISSRNLTRVDLDEGLTNQSGGVISGDTTEIQAGDVANSGTLQAIKALGLTSDSLNNSGALVSLSDLTLQSSGMLTNHGLLYAGGNANLFSENLNNYSDVLSGQDMVIARNAANERNTSVTNSSGTIESSGGDVSIYTDNLTNKRTTLEVQTVVSQDKRAQYPTLYNSKGTKHEPTTEYYRTDNCTDRERGNRCTWSYRIISGHEFTVLAYKESVRLKNASSVSKILAKEDLVIGAGTVLNNSSQIAGENVSISANSLTNKGYQFSEHTTYYDYKLSDRWSINTLQFNRVNTRRVNHGGSQLNSSITATNRLNLNVSNTVNNSTIRANSAVSGSTAQSRQLQATQSAVVSGPDNLSLEHLGDVDTIQSADIEAQTVSNTRVARVGQPDSATEVNLKSHNEPEIVSISTEGVMSRRDSAVSTPDKAVTTDINSPDSLEISNSIIREEGRYTHATNRNDVNGPSEVSISSGNIGGSNDLPDILGQVLSEESGQTKISRKSNVSVPPVAKALIINEQPRPDIRLISTGPVPFPEFRLPTQPNGLFVFSPKPEGRYVIETNPLLTNLDQFLGSDYFQNQVDYYPEEDVTFLGDAFYDTRVITQAIFEQTGQRYLGKNVGSDLAQMQQLMDSAAAEKQALDLQVGIALSAEQVASLSHDIVWYETIEVNGQSVLAPKLYLAEVTKNHIVSGAQIAATHTDIQSGDLDNSGEIVGFDSLKVVSQDGISNKGGTIRGGNVSLTAENDILNLSGDILGENLALTSSSGSVINETLVKELRAMHGGGESVFTDIGRTANIGSGNSLSINAGENIENIAASISAGGDVSLAAVQDIVLDTKANTHAFDVDLGRKRVGEKTTEHIGSSIGSGGQLSIVAGRDVSVTASEISAIGDLNVHAIGDVTVQTAKNLQSDHLYRSGYSELNRSTSHQGSSLSGSDVVVTSGSDITLSGSQIMAEGSASLKAKQDINVLAVNDSQYHFDKTVSKKSFGRSKTTINETYHEKAKGSVIAAGEDITLTAQNLDSILTPGGDSDIRLIGSELNAQEQVSLTADGDVTLAAQSYKTYERHESIKKGFGGLSGHRKGSIDDATLLNSSYVINSGDASVTSGQSIGVLASEVTSGGDVNLNAIDDVLVAAGEVLKQSQQWDEKSSFLSGGNLFEMEKKRQGEQSSTAQASQISAGGNLNVEAGSIKVVGSSLTSEQDASLKADTGNVEVLSAKESISRFESEEKLSVGLGDFNQGISFDDGTLKVTLGEAKYDKVTTQSEETRHQGSAITSRGNLSLSAESDIRVEGSDLRADADSDRIGDLNLEAKDSIIVKEVVDQFKEQKEEVHGSAEVSLVVQHQAAEVVKAAEALKDSTKRLKKAQEDYKQYKKGLDSLSSTLARLEQEYSDKKPGVSFEDVEELRDLVSDVKSDEAWYVSGVALAAEDVTSKTTLLAQQSAAASQSAATYGFNAGLHFDIQASQTDSTTQQTTSIGSNLSGQNVVLNAGQKNGDQALVRGSIVEAKESLTVAANEVNLEASQDTYHRQSQTESGSIGASLTVYGASSGINLTGSSNRSEETTTATTHTNSKLSGQHIAITSQADTNVNGANVTAKDSLVVNVGGDLNIASVQDRHSSSQRGSGFSTGLSLGGGDMADGAGDLPEGMLEEVSSAGDVKGANGGFNASNGRTRSKQTVLTSLTSGGYADVQVTGNTDIKGALIGTLNESGKDTGELSLTTESLTYSNLTNSNYSQNQNLGVNTGLGINSGQVDATGNTTSAQYQNMSGYSKSKTLATVGQGQLTIADSENSDDTSRLNRDIEHTDKDLFSVDRQQGDIDVTVDHRLLTEEGREQIAKDVETNNEAGQDIYRAAETYANSDDMNLFDFGTAVSDNRKVTELKNDLLSSQEGVDLLKDLKSTDTDTVLAAQAEISRLAQEKYGLAPEQVNFYNGDETTSLAMQDNALRDVHGGVVTDDDHELHGEVNVDVSDATTKTELINTVGHETYESITENTMGEQTAAQEDLAIAFGNQLEGRVNQAAGGDLDSTVGDNWNSSLVNSSTAQLGTERVNKVGNANVDYYLTPKQQESKQQELNGCGNDNRCQINVVRKYGAIDASQEFERDRAKYGQLAENIKDGVTNVVDAVSSPIDTVSGWIDSLKGVTPESVAEAVNAGADNQHQTLVDRDLAFIIGDSEKLGKSEGDIATEYLSTQSVPGGAGVVGKVVDKLNRKSTVIPSDTSSVRSQVLENIEKNKAAKPTDNFNVYTSKEKARQFYLDQGWEGKWIDSHLEGIDFTKPVSVETLKSGEQVYQWQVPNAQQGNYYTPDKVTRPDELGINPQAIHRDTGELVDKVQSPYKVNKDVKVLQSTAKEIEDTWSVPDEPYNTSGGGTQLFTSDKASLEKLEE